jgi:adenosylhomocysteine nucleosidase
LSRVGVVTGLPREARLLRGLSFSVRCEGPGATNARRAAEALIREGVEALVSFGVAGALDPKLKPGDIVRTTGAGVILNVAEPVASPAEKSRLFREAGAVAVDMESEAVAEVAHAAGVRFLAVRAIVDPAHRTLPRSVRAGGIDMRALLARPGDWFRLMALARDWRRAKRALRDVALGGGGGLFL